LLQSAFAGLRLSSAQTKGLSAIDSLRLCFARVKLSPTWDILCKAFILCNLADIDSLGALTLLYSEVDPGSVEGMKDLVRYMASYKHTKTEYTECFAQILHETHCQVRSHLVMNSLKQRESLREARRHQAVLSGAAFRKPSLTQLLEAKLLTDGSKHPQDSFGSFCKASKFASNVNMRIKHVAYFLVTILFFRSEFHACNHMMGGCRYAFQSIQTRPPACAKWWGGIRSSSRASRASRSCPLMCWS